MNKNKEKLIAVLDKSTERYLRGLYWARFMSFAFVLVSVTGFAFLLMSYATMPGSFFLKWCALLAATHGMHIFIRDFIATFIKEKHIKQSYEELIDKINMDTSLDNGGKQNKTI